MNPQLASRALAREERPQLLSSQADTPWGAAISEGEIIVLGTPVLKRRFLSVKSRPASPLYLPICPHISPISREEPASLSRISPRISPYLPYIS